MISEKTQNVLFNTYYTANNPAAFSSSDRLFYHLKSLGYNIKKHHVVNWLKKQKTYSLHKDRRVKFKRCKYNINNIDDLWEIDLMDMQNFSRKNKGFKYVYISSDRLF